MNSSCTPLNRRPLSKNIYHIHVPLFVLDVVRMFQDHPKYKDGIKHRDLVDLLRQEYFANGDLESQIESAVRSLEYYGYLRRINNGYRTLGPYARLAIAKTPKKLAKAWEEIQNKL